MKGKSRFPNLSMNAHLKFCTIFVQNEGLVYKELMLNRDLFIGGMQSAEIIKKEHYFSNFLTVAFYVNLCNVPDVPLLYFMVGKM